VRLAQAHPLEASCAAVFQHIISMVKRPSTLRSGDSEAHRFRVLTSVNSDDIERIVRFEEPSPGRTLGPKIVKRGGAEVLLIRAYLPRAQKAWVTISGDKKPMEMVRSQFYEARLAKENKPSRYTISFVDASGFEEEREDPYSFGPIITDFDLHLIGEGTHRKSYEKLGAHVMTLDGVEGVHFAVWAPNARCVSVVGDFNHWRTGAHPTNSRGPSGLWELFVPRLVPSELYKFAIRSNIDGSVTLKTDPYAFETELRPNTAAVVSDLGGHVWKDKKWLEGRSGTSSLDRPISIYEVHLGSWKKKADSYLSYREIADQIVPYVEKLGFTHIELMPVMEHPLDDSWGYQVVNFYAPTSRFGNPSDLMYLVDKCHQRGIGVILDWVPGHFPRDDYGLAFFDGTHLFSHADPRQGLHTEWGTLIFNFSRNEVRTFLISNAIFWLEKYHVDGLRIDAVASMLYLDYARQPGEWVPNEHGGKENLAAISFLRELNQAVHSYFPGAITIAEESTAWPGVTSPVDAGGLGFDLKWNMGWMHDTLEYFSKNPVHRKYHQNNLTFGLWYGFDEKFVLVLSHDEVVYGKKSLLDKMSGDVWQKFANLRLLYGFMFAHPGKKHLFMGGEFGQWGEWNFRTGLEWGQADQPLHSNLSLFVQDLTFIRKSKEGKKLLVAFNMSPVARFDYWVGVPEHCHYKEILNSDASEYGGSGLGNLGGVDSVRVPWNGRPYSLSLTLPPLAMVVFLPEKQ
jgi:1,4-alpha-glucan branching enzyme